MVLEVDIFQSPDKIEKWILMIFWFIRSNP